MALSAFCEDVIVVFVSNETYRGQRCLEMQHTFVLVKAQVPPAGDQH